jgi:hypothetical protein
VPYGATTLAVGRLADDSAAQEKWLSKEAKERGFRDTDDMAERDYTLFEKLADLFRRQHPAEALLSRGGVRCRWCRRAASWRPTSPAPPMT